MELIMGRVWLRGAILGATAWLALLTGWSGSSAEATVELRVLVQAHLDLANNGNVAGLMATFSEDAVLIGAGLCQQAPCEGKAAIQKEIERRATVGVQHKIMSLHSVTSLDDSSGSGSGRLELRAGLFSACGVERVVATLDVAVENNLISYYSTSFDTADGQTAAFLACMAAGGPQAPAVRPPSTGTGGLVAPR